ncbi:hypothetical protein [Lysobacter sp. CFH 32150]|uniref:hypothetical protein n=1 Tax=Lysobacter sp. CFH 32150 TaxID=2927128 RepID=UPI001FA6E8A1|nr:hypothetical protein [Lysobacter sp. CFH 32150]MCI4568620.1 hypothetical protein [Lysobacter sp. CFH 32150]
MTCFRFLAGCLAGALCAPVLAAEGIRVVNEGGIRDEWTLPQGYKLAMPVYPAAYVEQPAEVCVALGYLINPDGSTSDFALLKSWTSVDVPNKGSQDYWAAFANAAAQALSQWRFQPRPEVTAPRPVYTVATMIFAGSSDLRSHCAIPNLATRLRELRQDTSTRRKMNTALFDRLELDSNLREQDTMRQPRM